jgi:hypothetical protein
MSSLPRRKTLPMEIVSWLFEKLQRSLELLMPHNFNGRLGMHWVLSKFVPRLLTDDRNNDFPAVKISSREQITVKIFWKMSWSVMGHWFMVMMLKRNNNPHTGKVLLYPIPESTIYALLSESNAAVSPPPNEALCIMNSLLKVRQLIWFLSGTSEKSAGYSKTKAAWNVNCGKLTPPSQ